MKSLISDRYMTDIVNISKSVSLLYLYMSIRYVRK